MLDEDLRITQLRKYLIGIVKEIGSDIKELNANMLSDDTDCFSIDKIPVETEVESWIIGVVKRRDVYSFRSRMEYSIDTINNLSNIGFFEKFEKAIKTNNDKGVLPDIINIESIECLNCGTMVYANPSRAEFDIQIQITYRENEGEVSL